MGDAGDKIRLATAAFYEADRLGRALGELLGLGLSARDVRLLAKRELIAAGSAWHRALAERGEGLGALIEGSVLQAADAFAADILLAGEIGAMLRAHLDNGAVVATAIIPTPAMQAQCMRILLRHSLDVVHAQEVPSERVLPQTRNPASATDG